MARLALFAYLLAGTSAVLAGAIPSSPGNCDVKSAKPGLPSGQTNVTVPVGQTTQRITLGVGFQNYTCSNSGTYTSAGAVATLYDISCLVGRPEFSSITQVTYNIWKKLPNNQFSKVFQSCPSKNFPVFADHYFITSPSGSGISPVFDARATSHRGDPNAYVLVKKTGGLTAPTGKQNVDWLQLSSVQGNLAKTVLRVDTQQGQPPSSCTNGSAPISVKYTANYYFLA